MRSYVDALRKMAAHRAPLDAGGEVDRAADDRVLGPLLGADIAHHGLAAVDADPHLEARAAALDVPAVDVDHRPLHGERGGGGALGVVRMGQRRAEHGEDGVADELVDGAAIFDDDVGHAGQVLVQHTHHLLGIALLGEAGVTAQVRHEDGDVALLPAEP